MVCVNRQGISRASGIDDRREQFLKFASQLTSLKLRHKRGSLRIRNNTEIQMFGIEVYIGLDNSEYLREIS